VLNLLSADIVTLEQVQAAAAPTEPAADPVGDAALIEPESTAGKVLAIAPGACRWPIGDPGTSAFEFCRAPASAGQSYCSDHRRRAYRVPFRPAAVYRLYQARLDKPREPELDREDAGILIQARECYSVPMESAG
jgi:hypothetical protein